jgi:hypothetical protein
MNHEIIAMNRLAPLRVSTAALCGKLVRCLALGIGVAVGGLCPSWAQTAGSELPTGFSGISIAAGTGTAKKTTLISIPLLEDLPAGFVGSKTGRITAVGTDTITAGGAGWAAGSLSTAATPYLIEITSGAAEGLIMLISTTAANTSDTVTIHASEMTRAGNLQNLGIATGAGAGDTYRIWPVDTLGSFFGTPETTGIQGGTSPANADTVTLEVNGSATTYFYHTGVTPARWARVALGSPDASNVPILPYAGVQYARLATTPLEYTVIGRMPSGMRKVAVKNSGITLLSPYWPVRQTLASMGLQDLPGWGSAASAAEADTVVLSAGGSATTYFHDGSNWRRVGLGSGIANDTVVAAGTSVLITKKGSAPGFTTYQHAAPYSLP